MYRYLARLSLVGALFLTSPTTGEIVHHAVYPDVSDTEIVFAYRDAIWIAPLSGGKARLLSDVGERPRHPKFSPNNKKIAYSASVDDNQDVYVVDVSGGPIRRVTNHPARDELVDWHVDGDRLWFKSTMQSPRAVYNRLFSVSSSGGLPVALPLPYVETAAQSADGQQILFTYLRDFQEEVWKRYLGGRAPDIWSYDLASGSSRKLTHNPAPDSVPMLADDKVYYLSERGEARRSNLWVFENDDSDAQQVTFFTEQDVRNPSIGDAGVVFESGGDLYLQGTANGAARKLDISIAIARDERQSSWVSLKDRVEGASIGPEQMLAFEARGDILVYDTDKHTAINITNTSNAAERHPSISPSGTKVAYLSDVKGEYQLVVHNLKTHQVQDLTDFVSGFRYRPFWSPDERFLAFMDEKQFIWLVDTKNGSAKKVDQGHWRYHWDMPQFRISWSPDGRWFAYSRAGENRNQAVFVFDTQKGRKHQVTSAFYSDFDPVFDPSGNYIAAVAYRSFKPTFGDIDSTFTYTDSMVVTLLPLTKAIGAPGDIDWQMPKSKKSVEIEFDGLESRIRQLPFEPGQFSMLAFSNSTLTVVSVGSDLAEVLHLDLEKEAPTVAWAGERVEVFDATTSGTLIRNGDDKILLVGLENDNPDTVIQVEKLRAKIDPHQEYLQMFDDSWRYQRDFYYDPGMHGVDWSKIKDHYRPLAAQAYSEQELTAVVREMHAELAAGHVYVSVEPPYNRRDAGNVGLLGVDFEVRNGAYVIKRILRPGVRRSRHRSPLDNAALDVEEGDYLLAVNGRALTIDDAPWSAFQGLANEEVELTFADNASGLKRRILRVRTLASERKLRELVWVEETRKQVDEASEGRIGYIYVPNTGAEGQNELMQMYRAQYHKDALIIDERFNTGGALGDRLVELLNRPPLNYFSSRNANDYPLPELAHRGPKAMLINSWSYSGGDGFPFLFKSAGVGPLIGTQTWGGLIGPGMRMSLINGGFISAPPQRVYDVAGNWAEGNEGVRPNIRIQNNPGILASGIDEQLREAIKILLARIATVPDVIVPAFPHQTPLENAGK